MDDGDEAAEPIRTAKVADLLAQYAELSGEYKHSKIQIRGPRMLRDDEVKPITTLPIEAISIKNYRSFGDTGLELRNIRKLNLFIGKNNSGKSNIIHALMRFGLSTKNIDPLSMTDYHMHLLEAKLTYSVTLSYNAIRTKLKSCEILDQMQKAIPNGIPICIDEKGDLLIAQSEAELPLQTNGVSDRTLEKLLKSLVGEQSTSHSRDETVRGIFKELHKIFRSHWGNVFPNQYLIPIHRRIAFDDVTVDFNSPDQKPGFFQFDGKGVIAHIKRIQVPPPGQSWRRTPLDKLITFLQDLIGDKSLSLEVPAEESMLIVKTRNSRIGLDCLGTGIHQLVIMCAALIFLKDGTVYIEEPEIHMHPDLQRHFLRFLLRETSNRYFITTHSNVILDEAPSGHVSIWHVSHNGMTSSVRPVKSMASSRSLLDDLGYKASDLLMSNCIIWVEGPSDRVYILKWLSLFDDRLLEGLHFSFIFYGGSCLAGLSFVDSEDGLINALMVNPKSFVVMDRDAPDGTAPKQGRVERVVKELGNDKTWVTFGLEIENYLRPETVHASAKGQYPNIAMLDFGPSDDLAAKFENIEGLPKKYDKVRFAKIFTSNMTIDDLNVHDLRHKIELLARQIREWNIMTQPVS